MAFSLALLLQWQAQAVPPEVDPRPGAGRGATRLAAASSLLLLSVVWVGVTSRALAPAAPDRGWMLLAGVASALAGIALRTAAIRALGKGFASSFEPVIATRLRTGIYRRVVHPAEAGLLLWAAGEALLLRRAAAALVVVALFPLSLARVRAEELALKKSPAGGR